MNERQQYEENGFYIHRNFYSIQEVSSMLCDAVKIERISGELKKTAYVCGAKFVIPVDREIGSNRFLRAEWVTHIAQSSSILTTSSKMSNMLNKITGFKNYDQLIFQLNTKFPLDSITYPWHQDKQVDKGSWVSREHMDGFVLANIALSKCNSKNGALRVFSGSHKLGPLDVNIVSDSETLNKYRLKYPEVILDLNPGDIAFFSPYLLHSSLENKDDQPRRIYVAGYSISGAYSRKNYFSITKLE